jgi:hypothetical protein
MLTPEDIGSILDDNTQSLKSTNTRGYGEQLIPSALDNKIANIINIFSESDEKTRQTIRVAFNQQHSFTFLTFSERMAALAVRKGSFARLFEGLIAHALENGCYDTRENIIILSILYRSAVKLGLDPFELFEKTATYATEPMAAILKAFPNRSDLDKSIETMGFKEASDQDGFLYLRLW